MPRFTAGDRNRTINFRLPIELFDRLAALAAADDRSINRMAVRLLTEAMDARDAKAKRAAKAAA